METCGKWRPFVYETCVAVLSAMLLVGKYCTNAECIYDEGDCPSVCECTVFGDILHVNCSNADFPVLPDTLPQCDSLRLDISRNKLTSLGYKYYMNASLTIDASHNRISSISDVFVSSFSTSKLQNLHLQNNKLTSLTAKEVHFLDRLKSVTLIDNPWNCDCGISRIHNWISTNKNNIPSTHQDLDRLSCFIPQSLHGQRIAEIELDNVCEEPEEDRIPIWLPIVITVCCIIYLSIISLIGICIVLRRRVKIVDQHKLDSVN